MIILLLCFLLMLDLLSAPDGGLGSLEPSLSSGFCFVVLFVPLLKIGAKGGDTALVFKAGTATALGLLAAALSVAVVPLGPSSLGGEVGGGEPKLLCAIFTGGYLGVSGHLTALQLSLVET